jgi:RHS repeat-associated protein
MRRGSTSSIYLVDALGSVRQVVNNPATMFQAQYTYRPFGELLSSSGTLVNPFRWVGEVGYYYDVDRLAQYVRARTYNPKLARWLSRDPLGLGGNEFNLYRYAMNSPSVGIDPSGRVVAKITDFTPEDLSWCYRGLTQIATTKFFGNKGPYPCAAALLFGFLHSGARPADPCPDACITALKSKFETDPFDYKIFSPHASCGRTVTFSGSESRLNVFDTGDLFYALNRTMLEFNFRGKVDCEPAKGCCCKCTTYWDYDLIVHDTYDFCDSLDPNTPKRELAWCGCLLEQEKRGKPYQVRCPLSDRIGAGRDFDFCNLRDPHQA